MTNTTRNAIYYKLAFKNNLQLTEDLGKVGLLGEKKEVMKFYDDIEEYYMNKPGFETFLQEKHYEENPTLLDDDLSEAFDNWVANLEAEDYERYYDEWKSRKRTPNENIKELKEITKEGLFKSMGLTDEDGDDLLDEKLRYNDQHDLID